MTEVKKGKILFSKKHACFSEGASGILEKKGDEKGGRAVLYRENKTFSSFGRAAPLRERNRTIKTGQTTKGGTGWKDKKFFSSNNTASAQGFPSVETP